MTRGSWTGKFIYALYHPLNFLLLISISIFLMRIHIFTLITYEWIQQIQNEFGSSKDFRIDKVVYNGDNDITELIKKGRPIIEDDLPF